MAERPQPVNLLRAWPGVLATGLVLFLTVATLAAVALFAEAGAGLSSGDWGAIRFTVTQASVSAALSVLLAIPVARALARRQFPGRTLLITLLGAPFLLPVIVAILGLLAVFGRSGLLNQALGWSGLEPLSVYGFHGVVLAHVFFNLPLVSRLILQGWAEIPAERLRLAEALAFSQTDRLRHLEWPMLRTILPGAFLVVFLVCTTSFAVALTLGGGPRATTIELAIYQAFRFEFDLGKAAWLGLLQFGIGAAGAALLFTISKGPLAAPALDRAPVRHSPSSGWLRLQDTVAILLASAFLLLPLSLVVLRGVPGLLDLPLTVYAALLRSFGVALASTALVFALALPMAVLIVRSRAGVLVEAVGMLAISASPLVIGTGLFIMLHRVTNPLDWALPITALVNAAMALPFVLRVILPPLRSIEADFGPLADSLALTGWRRMRIVVLPRLGAPLGFAAGLTAALSMGDLGVIALFGDPNTATLPLQLYRLMGSYQMEAAAGAALLLLAASLGLFWAFDTGGRTRAAT